MKKLLLAMIFTLLTLLGPASVLAVVPCDSGNIGAAEAVKCGVNGASGSSQTPAEAQQSLSDKIQQGLNLASAAIGLLAVLMFVYAGFRYATSAGSQEGIKAAKDTMIYAFVGLIIVALAQAIVHFVINNV